MKKHKREVLGLTRAQRVEQWFTKLGYPRNESLFLPQPKVKKVKSNKLIMDLDYFLQRLHSNNGFEDAQDEIDIIDVDDLDDDDIEEDQEEHVVEHFQEDSQGNIILPEGFSLFDDITPHNTQKDLEPLFEEIKDEAPPEVIQIFDTQTSVREISPPREQTKTQKERGSKKRSQIPQIFSETESVFEIENPNIGSEDNINLDCPNNPEKRPVPQQKSKKTEETINPWEFKTPARPKRKKNKNQKRNSRSPKSQNPDNTKKSASSKRMKHHSKKKSKNKSSKKKSKEKRSKKKSMEKLRKSSKKKSRVRVPREPQFQSDTQFKDNKPIALGHKSIISGVASNPHAHIGQYSIACLILSQSDPIAYMNSIRHNLNALLIVLTHL